MKKRTQIFELLQKSFLETQILYNQKSTKTYFKTSSFQKNYNLNFWIKLAISNPFNSSSNDNIVIFSSKYVSLSYLIRYKNCSPFFKVLINNIFFSTKRLTAHRLSPYQDINRAVIRNNFMIIVEMQIVSTP